MDCIAPDMTTTSIAYNDVSALMSVNPLESLGQGNFALALQDSLSDGTKISPNSWDGNLLSIRSDTALSIELHQHSNTFSAHPPATPHFNSSTSAYSTDAIFGGTTPPSASASASFMNSDPIVPSFTVSPNQIYPLTPSSPVLGEPFTTPIKREPDGHLGFNGKSSTSPFKNSKLPQHPPSDFWTLANPNPLPLDFDFLSPKSSPPPDSDHWSHIANPPSPAHSYLRSRPISSATPLTKQRRSRVNRRKQPTKTHYHSGQNGPIPVSLESTSTNVCKICSNRFKRSEHLTRHVDSVHDFNKDFPCPYCLEISLTPGKETKERHFNRADNLKQHIIKTHLTLSDKGRAKRLFDEDRKVWMVDEIKRFKWMEIFKEVQRKQGVFIGDDGDEDQVMSGLVNTVASLGKQDAPKRAARKKRPRALAKAIL